MSDSYILSMTLLMLFNKHCLLQDYLFRGTERGPSLYVHNNTNINQLGAFAVYNTSGAVVDMATFSPESQPPVDSKYNGYTCR